MVSPSRRAASASIQPPRRKPWRFDVQAAEGPIDVDAFLRRLVDVLLSTTKTEPEASTDGAEQ